MPTWNPQANNLFLEAQGLPPNERQEFLDRVCAGDATLRADVQSLLDVNDRADGFLEAPAGGVNTTEDQPPEPDAPSAVIGPYKLLQQIGEGGMGVVFMAEQTHPVNRRVALKVIKAGMDTRQVIARFEAERQALALMDHPNIARVLDAGETPEGRPYFVMELVRGVPITKYCDDHRLSPRQRLELFVQVCHAVQHAHQKGVIHRDLKPSNILIAPYDGNPVVKVIDFGIAKATGSRLTEKTLFTEFGAVVGTLEYMSPEQAELNNQDIDTRSDVYSLGVLLYELLTGTTPLDRPRLRQVAFAEILRMIREEEPPKPSTRLSDSKDSLPSISAQRQMEPAKLTRLVRGDLDWVVMKALEKNRSRRYETANGLAADVQRYLADEPVQACPPTAGYRLRKFVRRNRRSVLAASLVLLALVLGLVGTTLGILRARQAESDAWEAESQARQEAADAVKARKETRKALETLSHNVIRELVGKQSDLVEHEKKFLRNILKMFEEFAATEGDSEEARSGRADAYDRIGQVQMKLGDRAEAERSFQSALSLYAGLVADFPGVPAYRHKLAGMHNDMAHLYEPTGRLTESMAAYHEALAIQTRLVADVPSEPEYREELARIRLNLGTLLHRLDRIPEAEKSYQEAITELKQLVREHPGEPSYRHFLAITVKNLGDLSEGAGKLELAEKLIRETVVLREALVKEQPDIGLHLDNLASSYSSLGTLLAVMGRAEDWVSYHQKAHTMRRELVKRFPGVPAFRQSLAHSANNLGVVKYGSGLLDEAEVLLREAVSIYRQLHEFFPTVADHAFDIATGLVNLAMIVRDRMKPADRKKPGNAIHKLHSEALTYAEAAYRINSANPEYREVRDHLTARTLINRGDYFPAAAKAEEMASRPVHASRSVMNASLILAASADLATEDARLPTWMRRPLAEVYATRAVALMRGLLAKEIVLDPVDLELEPDFNGIRDRSDFKALVADLKKARKN